MRFMKTPYRPFSPALLALTGVVVGMCFVVVSYAFVRDMSPREVLRPANWMQPSDQSEQPDQPNQKPNLNEVIMVEGAAVVPTSTLMQAQQAFETTPFRVIKVLESPDKLYTYIVATPRAGLIQTGSMITGESYLVKTKNDVVCGSADSQPVCYLLREGKAIEDEESDPRPKVITAWSGGAFSSDTPVKFVKEGQGYLLQFMTTTKSDAGCSIKFSHQVDLATSQYGLLKRTDTCSN